MTTEAIRTAAPRTDWRAAMVGVVLALLVGVSTVAAGDRTPLLVVGTLGALTALATTAVVTRGRTADLLLLGAVALMSIPIDKYFLVQDHVGGWPGIRLSISDLGLLVLVPLAAIGALAGRVRSAIPRGVAVVYVLLLAQYVLSFINAPHRDLALFELLSALHALVLAGLIAATMRRELLRPVVALIAIQVVVHTAFAFAQAATGRPIGAEWFGGGNVVAETLETGAVELRPSGLFDHPIVYADMLLLFLPVLVAGLFGRGGWLWRASIGTAALIGTAGLVLTLSRGAWIGTVCAFIVLLALAIRHRLLSARRVRAMALAACVAVLVLVPIFGPRAYERVVASNPDNLGVRFELNWIAVSMMEAHPLLGVGLNNFIPVMDHYDPTNVMRRFPATVHNVYLLEGAEAGVPALLLFVALFAAILVAGVRRLSSVRDASARWVAAALVAGIVGFLVTQLADFSHRLEPLRSVIWMNIGMLFALERDALKVQWRRFRDA